jgi:hypothetical protein
MPLHRIEQLFSVISDALLEDVFDVRDASGRITFHHREVRVLPNGNGADLILSAEINRTG